MPREVALAAFMFSAEFANFTRRSSATTACAPRIDAVMDFYRGLLARLPDDGGFNFWVGRFRDRAVPGPGGDHGEVEAISSAFALSASTPARNRTNAQYVGDLYNAFLRRGGDLGGVQFWIRHAQPARQTREQVRVQFKNSPEFQARVNAIIAQGLPVLVAPREPQAAFRVFLRMNSAMRSTPASICCFEAAYEKRMCCPSPGTRVPKWMSASTGDAGLVEQALAKLLGVGRADHAAGLRHVGPRVEGAARHQALHARAPRSGSPRSGRGARGSSSSSPRPRPAAPRSPRPPPTG
jgi:hypothetical protein